MDKILRNVIIFVVAILIIAAVAIVLALAESDSSQDITAIKTDSTTTTVASGEFQDVKLSVSGGTYILNPSTLKNGVPVRMEADLTTVRGCARDVVITAFNVRKYVKTGDNIIMFTPTKSGTFKIACSMNMYTGTFKVE